MIAEGKNDTVTVSYKLSSTCHSLSLRRMPQFYSPDLEIFFTSRPDSFEAWEGLYQKRDSLQNWNANPWLLSKKVPLVSVHISGSPGSLLDSLSSCSIGKHHGRANSGKQGSRERSCPRKITRSKSSVFTIFLCLTSWTTSLSLNDHCRKK